MDRVLLHHLPVVAAVARLRSFAAAAAELDLGASAVSHSVRLVETRLRLLIFARTTRNVALTEAGAAFIAEAGPALDRIHEDMIAVRLTPPFRSIVVAGPAYLAAHGEPGSIADLAAHNCIGDRQVSRGGAYPWALAENGREGAVAVTGTARVTDPFFAVNLALAGVGLAYMVEPMVRQHIRSGALRWVLPEAAVKERGLFLYFPPRQAETPKLRAFIDTARQLP